MSASDQSVVQELPQERPYLNPVWHAALVWQLAFGVQWNDMGGMYSLQLFLGPLRIIRISWRNS